MSENLGFLTVVEQAPGVLTGGYLVLNRTGRPLEFHCTLPLSPDRIQQILYGDALKPFIYGERIAQTLIQRSKLPVLAVLTSEASVLSAQPLIDTPIVYVFGDTSTSKRPPLTTPMPISAPAQTVQTESAALESEQAESELTKDTPAEHSAMEHSETESAPTGFAQPEQAVQEQSVQEQPVREQPVREISAELSESLKTFGIHSTRFRSQETNSDVMPSMPGVSGFDTEMWQPVRLGNRVIAVPERPGTEWNELLADIKTLAKMIDVLEPFSRIRFALEAARAAA